MKKGLTELVFIIDKSGSMEDMVSDTIGGFNSMLAKQKEVDGEAYVSTVLFSNKCDVIHDRVPIDKVEPMTNKDYVPFGSTALLDAIGGAIHHIENIHKYAREEDIPEHTIFCITTDGYENASHCYNSEAIKEMIKRKGSECGWEFVFIAANIDAVETATNIGIKANRAANYMQNSDGTHMVFECLSSIAESVRCNKNIDDDWAKGLEKKSK